MLTPAVPFKADLGLHPLSRKPLDCSLKEVDHSASIFFVTMAFIAVLLQKIAVPSPAGPVSLIAPVLLLGYAALSAVIGVRISVPRLVLYSLVMNAAVVSQLVSGRPFSAPSMLLVFVTYLVFVFRVEIGAIAMRRNLSVFQGLVTFACVIALAQQLWQITVGGGSFPNMEDVLPRELLLPGFVYIQPLYYGSPYLKPNGFFFLEVSFLSQFIAIATVVELVYFGRLWRLSLFGATLFAIFAGTGLLLLALVSPALIARLPWHRVMLILILMAIVVTVALGLGWYEQIEGRFGEMGNQSSSTYLRFIDPWVRLLEFLRRPDALYAGQGAGSTPLTSGVVWWSFTKLATEYGLLTAGLFYIFLSYALFSKAPSYRVALTLLLWYSFMGSNLLSFPVIAVCLLLGATFRPVDRALVASSADNLDGGVVAKPAKHQGQRNDATDGRQ